MNDAKRKDADPCVNGTCDCMMRAFMQHGGKTADVNEAAALYLGNSFLVDYTQATPFEDGCAAITKAFIDGAYWAEHRTQPKDTGACDLPCSGAKCSVEGCAAGNPQAKCAGNPCICRCHTIPRDSEVSK